MANEVLAAITLNYSRYSPPYTANTTFQADQTGDQIFRTIQLWTATSAEWFPLTFTGAPTPRYIYLKNLDATDTIELTAASNGTSKIALLNPGQWFFFPVASGAALYLGGGTSADGERMIECWFIEA